MKYSKAFAIVASLLGTATAHGGVQVYTVGNTAYEGWFPYDSPTGQVSVQRIYPSYNPLLMADLTTVNIRCNNPGTLGTGIMGTVAAGQAMKATWNQWTHLPTVIMVYMAKCPSTGCNSWDGSGTGWFKIFQQGLISGTEQNGIWAGTQIVNTLNYTITIPSTLAAGDYLIRHELLALHQANNPQFYPECAQFTVTGSGTASPGSSWLVAFPGAYNASDPSIDFDIDSAAAAVATTYTPPGPPVWDGSSSSTAPSSGNSGSTGGTGSGSTSIAVVSSAVATTLKTSTVASSKPAVSSSAAVCTPVAKYGQCGGTGYTGCTSCASGSTCQVGNSYYSQCL